MRAVVLGVGLTVCLGGCNLIDQNTFNPHAGDRPVIPPAPVAAVVPVAPGPPPLLVVPPGAANYAETLAKAVAAARARKPGVVFDVVEIRRVDVDPETVGTNAAVVARGIVGQGVPADRVRLDVRPDTGGVPGEVRVFVR